MNGVYPHRNLLLFRSVRVSGDRDALRARQQLERSLAGVDGSAAGMPNAVLFVRRLVLAAATPASSFADRVSVALQHHASRAGRPWLCEDVGSADAVLFTDEAELTACLVRDWLRGRVAEHWWWRSVLGDLSAQEWLRRHVLARGELVPVIALLAPKGGATAWLVTLDDTEATETIVAVARSHAVSLDALGNDSAACRWRAPPGRHSVANVDSGPRAVMPSTALKRLVDVVPEVLTPALRPPQRRLVALALALVRAPSWGRTQLAFALQALERAGPTASAYLPPIPETTGPASAMPRVPDMNNMMVAADLSASPSRPEERAVSAERQEDSASGDRPGAQQEGAVIARAVGEAPAPLAETSPASVPTARSDEAAAVQHASSVRTQFGGIFYLLNAALALKLYADFTCPRGSNLRISPWDWLALIGRAWFGREFVRDPVWKLLAGLAVRGRRRLRWLRGLKAQNESLLARLALALGEEGSADIPAFVCRYPAEVSANAGAVHVHLSLASLPLALRIAGLDRDPGWIPAAGRTIAFHFE